MADSILLAIETRWNRTVLQWVEGPLEAPEDFLRRVWEANGGADSLRKVSLQGEEAVIASFSG